MQAFFEKKWKILVFILLLLYLLTHLTGLTRLPVFADEAIYIRWSQLMIEDFHRYAFFPLNDGKTPLHMWLMIPFLKLFSDPLFAGRLLSVVIGFVQLFVIQKIIQKIGGGRVAQFFGMLFVIVLPFWYFHHRMALIDGLLTFWISLLFLGILHLTEIAKNVEWLQGATKIAPKFSMRQRTYLLFWIVFSGVTLGLGFLTKLPTLFIIPALAPFVLWQINSDKHKFSTLSLRVLIFGIIVAIGGSIFLSLKLQPAFGQLFSRGEDFTFSTTEVFQGEWRTSIRTMGRLSGWLSQYMSLPLLLVGSIGLFISKQRPKHLVLWCSAIVFALPLVIFGKVLYPRYFMPMILALTISIALFVEEVFQRSRSKTYWTLVVLLIGSLILPVRFMFASMFDPNQIPFVSIDKEQYLTEWSAGNGIREITDLVEQKSHEGRIYVMTEGYFGTLPDGLLMYFHGKNVENIEIEGIGAPVRQLPQNFDKKAGKAKTVWLVVNSHRMELNDPRFERVYSFPRTDGAPSLDVYEFKR